MGTERGVLTAITGYGSTPPARGTFRHQTAGNSNPHLNIPPREARTRLLILRLLIHVLMLSPPTVEVHDNICQNQKTELPPSSLDIRVHEERSLRQLGY
ncbi:hypothetical protein AVEN_76660-1 [Araneus ventricosus]|uniref:Uncharacterized protein n=1 Tax=Araneus ventricosus TaxID=182803 RepID=A0A4Y2BRV7_ARAVE|nr:hypothetical protein AVEN_76660-1 [Araneus ventricosus]